MASSDRPRRRIDWLRYAQAGPVRTTNLETGETRVDPAYNRLQVKKIVSAGRTGRRTQLRPAAKVHASPDPAGAGPKALNKAASPGRSPE